MSESGGLEGMKDKLQDEDMTDKGLDKGGDVVDDKVGEQHDDKIDKAKDFGDDKLGG